MQKKKKKKEQEEAGRREKTQKNAICVEKEMENNVLPRFDIKKTAKRCRRDRERASGWMKKERKERKKKKESARAHSSHSPKERNKKSIVMSAMCYIIVAKQPQCYGNEQNEQREQNLFYYTHTYTAKSFVFRPVNAVFLLWLCHALLCSAPLRYCCYVRYAPINTFRFFSSFPSFALVLVMVVMVAVAVAVVSMVRVMRCCSGGRNFTVLLPLPSLLLLPLSPIDCVFIDNLEKRNEI